MWCMSSSVMHVIVLVRPEVPKHYILNQTRRSGCTGPIWLTKKSKPVIFKTISAIFRTNPVIFRTNPVICRTTTILFWQETNRNTQKHTEKSLARLSQSWSSLTKFSQVYLNLAKFGQFQPGFAKFRKFQPSHSSLATFSQLQQSQY